MAESLILQSNRSAVMLLHADRFHLRSYQISYRFFRRLLPVLSLVFVLTLTTTSSGRVLPVLDKVLQTAQQSHLLPPTQYIPDRNFDTRHIALDLRFDWEHEQLSGVETISFTPLLANLQKIELDAAEM